MSYEASIINQSLTMGRVIEFYRVDTLKKGKMCCPFHREKTPSFSVHGCFYHCFGCGAGGDVIKFIMSFFDLQYMDALKKLDSDFALGIGFAARTTLRARVEQKKKQQEFITAQQERERYIYAAEEKYWAVFDQWKRLDDNLRTYAPIPQCADLHPLYIDAIKNIAKVSYALDCADTERQVVENAD